MHLFNYWILSSLLFGHLIAGVNQEMPISSAEDSSVGGFLSREANIILYSQYKKSELEDDYAEDDIPYFSIQTRSLSNSSRLICSPYDSCIDRCGEKPRDLPYTCNCDFMCNAFSDCCIDYNQQCRHKDNLTVTGDQSPRLSRGVGCEIFFMKYNLLSVSECPQEYSDGLIKKFCLLKIPKDCNFPDNLNVSGSENVYVKCKVSVYRKCMSKFRSKCDVKVEPLCSTIAWKCNKMASDTCSRCNSSFWPVLSDSGVIYRNLYCALCNSQKSFVVLSPYSLEAKMKEIDEFNIRDEHSMYFARHCIPVDVDSCPEKVADKEMQSLCHNHSGAVIAGLGKRRVIYKNIHCAMCNGEEIGKLKCATMASLMRGLIRPLLETFVTGDVQGMSFGDIPAAFSILLNFGLDGRERMYFSSEGEEEMKQHQQRCGEGRIWDPFSEVCRRLYCSTEFLLVNYRCVRKESPVEEDSQLQNESISNIPDARSEFVHLTLSAEMEVLDILQFHGQDIESISETVRASLANSFEINIERIRDVRFNISIGNFGSLNETLQFIEQMDDLHPIIFKIEFDLYEDFVTNITIPEPSVDSIVSMLASSLSMNGFEFDINNVTSRIFEIHQTVSPIQSWCNSEQGGIKTEYWNSDFSLILNDNISTVSENQIKGIYVNKTGNFYSRGRFVVDILFQGYQFSNSLINVSGVAIVCDHIKLNDSCMRILVDSEEYSIFENGTLSIHNDSLRNVIDDSNYEIGENNSLWVCIKSLEAITSNKSYHVKMDIVQAMVSFVLLCISVIALALVLITYVAFGSLRNLPGCNTMNLTFSLIAMQITFLFGQRGTVTGTTCTVVGHLLHYEILCCFMWMNVMAFDLFRTFGNKNILSNIRSKRKYLPRYMIYAYFSPVSIIVTASLLDYFVSDSYFAPNYGRNSVCWISSQYSAIIFFAVPLAVIMCINFVFFLLTIFAMRSVKNLSLMKDQHTNRNGKNDLFLYARMALVIGLTWALSFAAASARKTELIGVILTYLFIIFNTLQGVFIFWIFVCNKRVYELYKDAFRKLFRKVSLHAKHESTAATISRLSNVMQRSTSTTTVSATLSNSSVSSNESKLSTVSE